MRGPNGLIRDCDVLYVDTTQSLYQSLGHVAVLIQGVFQCSMFNVTPRTT